MPPLLRQHGFSFKFRRDPEPVKHGRPDVRKGFAGSQIAGHNGRACHQKRRVFPRVIRRFGIGGVAACLLYTSQDHASCLQRMGAYRRQYDQLRPRLHDRPARRHVIAGRARGRRDDDAVCMVFLLSLIHI